MDYTPNKHLPLRHALSRISLSLRQSRIANSSADQALSVSDFAYMARGVIYRRKKVVLTAPGCTAATCTMCPIPNEALYGLKHNFHPDDFIRQFDNAFANDCLDKYDAVSVYNSGNWFANKEIPSAARKAIYQRVAHSSCSMLMVESLPQFITAEVIRDAKEILGDKKLVVGIGLQSADNFVRNVCVNTSCTKARFEWASELLWNYGFEPRVYIMIKPPFLSEQEAVVDCVNSIRYLRSVGFADVSICPTRVAPSTIIYELWKLGFYIPPSLWTVVNILKHAEASDGIRVTCLDLDNKDDDTLYPRSCPQCKVALLQGLIDFNSDQNIDRFSDVHCGCSIEQAEIEMNFESRPVEERITAFISKYDESLATSSQVVN